jgi:pimeloyl-ACP methyl ester carboxylesterase
MLKYAERGSGLPVVLIHGFPLCRKMWQPQMSALADSGCRVLCPDLPGFGESAPLQEPVSMSDYAEAVIGLLDALGIEKAVIGGMSMGGYVLLNLVERYPERLLGAMFLPQKKPQLVALVRQWMESTSAEGTAAGLLAMRDRDDSVARLANYALPALVIGAEQDLAVPLDHSRVLADGLPHAELKIISGAGHMANLEQPELFNAALLEFLRRLES